MLATYSKPTTSPAILAMGDPLYGLPSGSIPGAGSTKVHCELEQRPARCAHYAKVEGSSPSLASNTTPIKAGEGFRDRRPVVETAEGRNAVKPMGAFAINPGTRLDQFSRQA